MLRGGDNSIQETHYEILSVKEGASYEEIRSGYRSAILDSHPDKALNAPQSAGSKFLRVQKAWETLSDSRSRAAYDNELRSSRQQDAEASEDIDLEDMTVEERGGQEFELCYPCRCGDYYSVDCLELRTMGYNVSRDGSSVWFESDDDGLVPPASVILPCGSCSLLVRLLISRGTRVPVL